MTQYNNSFSYTSSWESVDMFAYNCISYLLQNNENIWKLIHPDYMTPDCLNKANLTIDKKRSLIYKGQPDSSTFRVFQDAGNNDAFSQNCAILKIYPAVLVPENKVIGTTSMAFECICHYKVNTLDTYSTRSLTMVKELIKSLSGTNIGGLGSLYFDSKLSRYNRATLNLDNSKGYSGYTLIMSTGNL